MPTLYFDIETGPAPDLMARMPDFQPAGNLKDPLKIKLDIETKQLKWVEEAALSAITGRVLAIGYAQNDEPVMILDDQDETTLIEKFWDLVLANKSGRLIGFNSVGFDLPFLFQRSWVHSIPVPWHLRNGRYWGAGVIDLRETWTLHTYGGRGNLDDVCQLLGLGGKLGHGGDFAKVWDTDRNAARNYLTRDVEITRDLGRRIDPRCQPQSLVPSWE